MAVSGTARTSLTAGTRAFEQAEQRVKAENVNLARSGKMVEAAQGTADFAVAVSDGASWGALASSLGTVLSLLGPYGRAVGVALTITGLLADQLLKTGEAGDKMASVQDRLNQAIAKGNLLTEGAGERARRLADEARQGIDRDFDTVRSDLEKENAALQAEFAEKMAAFSDLKKSIERLRPTDAASPVNKSRLDSESQAVDDLRKRLEENEELQARVRKEQEAFRQRAANPPPDSDLGQMLVLAEGKVEQQSRALSEARERVDEYTGAMKEQVAVLGDDTKARAESEAAIKAQNATLADGSQLVNEQTQGSLDLSEQRKKNREALTQFQGEVDRVAKELSDQLSGAVWNGLTGEGDADAILDWFRSLFQQIVRDALSTHIVLPIMKEVVGVVPGLFGIPVPANQNVPGGIAGGADGFGSSLFSGASSLASLAGPSTLNAWGASLGFAPGTAMAAPSAAFIGPMPAAQGSIFGGATLSGVLGAAGGGFLAGSALGPLLANGNKAVGGVVGAGSGAVTGAVIGSIIPGIGTLAGALIGGAAGGLGGLLGTTKPTVGPNYSVHFGPEGFQTALVDNGFSMEEARRNGEALAASIAAIAELTGGRSAAGFGIGWAKHGYEIHNFGGVAGRMGRFQDIGSTLRHALTQPGAIAGGDATMLGVLSRSTAKDAEGLIGDLQFAQGVIDLNRGLTQTDIAIRELNRTYDEQIRKAQELGLETTKLAEQRGKEISRLQEQRQTSMMDIEYGLAARVWRGRGDPAQALQADLLMFDFSARQQRISLRDQLEGLGELTTAYGVEMMRRLEEALAQERTEVVKAGNERILAAERELAQERIQAEQELARKRAQAEHSALSVVSGITQYVRSISIGEMSGLAPEQQFGLARSQFHAVSGAALAGDFGSLQQITGYADGLLRAARQQYGSGTGYAGAFAEVTEVLSRLSSIDPDQLTQQAFVVETRSQTQTLVVELQALRREVEMLRRETRQSGNAPARAA